MDTQELNEQLASEVKPVEEMGQYLQDKLIAVSTAIIGFTVVMFGSGKMVLLNLQLLKISWLLFGIYLVMAFCNIWASINYRARRVVRDSMIRIDEANLDSETNVTKKKEKAALLGMLKMKDFFDRDYWSKNKSEREKDEVRIIFRNLVDKYKEDILTISIKKNQDIDYRSKRDRVIDYAVKHYEWPYAIFGLGLLALILSAIF